MHTARFSATMARMRWVLLVVVVGCGSQVQTTNVTSSGAGGAAGGAGLGGALAGDAGDAGDDASEASTADVCACGGTVGMPCPCTAPAAAELGCGEQVPVCCPLGQPCALPAGVITCAKASNGLGWCCSSGATCAE